MDTHIFYATVATAYASWVPTGSSGHNTAARPQEEAEGEKEAQSKSWCLKPWRKCRCNIDQAALCTDGKQCGKTDLAQNAIAALAFTKYAAVKITCACTAVAKTAEASIWQEGSETPVTAELEHDAQRLIS